MRFLTNRCARPAPPLASHPAWPTLRTDVDVVVIGLGITGAGVALDAVSRGLSVLAVDAHDLAFGTSRWSSKLVHGGLRYLANGQFGVAHESAVERGILMEVTAPHLTHPMPMLIPLTSSVTATQAGITRGRPGRRRPAPPQRPHPAASPCLARAGSPPPRRSRWRPGCAASACAAACSPGTASSRTTPGWSRPSPAPRRRSRRPHPYPRPRPAPRPAPGSSSATSSPARPRPSPPAPSSTPPASGPATWSTRSRSDPVRGTHLVLRGRHPARPPVAGHRAGAGARPTGS